jgi:hypothetical protein
MLGFKSITSTRAILGGIEMVHMIRKGQAKHAQIPQPSPAEQFEQLAAQPLSEPPLHLLGSASNSRQNHLTSSQRRDK